MLGSTGENEPADELGLAGSHQPARRDIRHMMEERILERVNGESAGAGLKHAGENAVRDREASSDWAGAADEGSKCERVWRRRRDRRCGCSKSTAQERARALDHDCVPVRVED